MCNLISGSLLCVCEPKERTLLSRVSAGKAGEDMHTLAYAQDIEQNEHSAFARNLTQEGRAVPSSLIPWSLTACRIHSTVKKAMSEAHEQDFGSLSSSEDEKDRAGESQVDVGKVRQAFFLQIVQRMHAGYKSDLIHRLEEL